MWVAVVNGHKGVETAVLAGSFGQGAHDLHQREVAPAESHGEANG
ncbi:hypothetical protein ACFV23_02185 [Streptomyces sp. NPDC059627]